LGSEIRAQKAQAERGGAYSVLSRGESRLMAGSRAEIRIQIRQGQSRTAQGTSLDAPTYQTSFPRERVGFLLLIMCGLGHPAAVVTGKCIRNQAALSQSGAPEARHNKTFTSECSKENVDLRASMQPARALPTKRVQREFLGPQTGEMEITQLVCRIVGCCIIGCRI